MCPECLAEFTADRGFTGTGSGALAGTRIRQLDGESYEVKCPAHGRVAWRAVFHNPPPIIYPENIRRRTRRQIQANLRRQQVRRNAHER